MENFFDRFTENELIMMFKESEDSINKNGMFREDDFIYLMYQDWATKHINPMPFMFMTELYFKICKTIIK